MSQICPLEWRDGGNKILNSNCLSLPTEKAMETRSSVLAWRTPGTGGAWWAAVCGVAQSRTRLSDLAAAAAILAHTPQGDRAVLVSVILISFFF